MGFCTSCGNKLAENHRFCGSCGSPIDPPKESDSITNASSPSESTNEQFEIKKQIEMFYDADSIDRKTLYDDGM